MDHRALFIAACAPAFSACGKKKKSDDPATSSAGTAATVSTDSETSTALVGAQLDEATTALAAGDTSGSVTGSTALADVTTSRACAADSGGKGALVTLTYSGSSSSTAGKATVTDTASGSETRDWTSSAGSVVCTANAQYAKIAWKSPTAVGSAAGVNGLSLVVTTKRKSDPGSTYTTKKGAKVSRTLVTAEMALAMSPGVPPAAIRPHRRKTWTANVAKTYNLTKFDGSSVNLDSTHATSSTDPMVVDVTRNAAGVPQMHTIKSGTMTLTKTGSFYLTSSYAGVVFDLTSSDPCTPTAGTVTTNIYNSSSAAIKRHR